MSTKIITCKTPESPTADECHRLLNANYSADDVKDAQVLERTENSAVLYRIAGGYAVEGETGDIIAELDEDEAMLQWEPKRLGKKTLFEYLGKRPINACLRWNNREDMVIESGLIENEYAHEIKNVGNDGAWGWDFDTPMTEDEINDALDYIAEHPGRD